MFVLHFVFAVMEMLCHSARLDGEIDLARNWTVTPYSCMPSLGTNAAIHFFLGNRTNAG